MNKTARSRHPDRRLFLIGGGATAALLLALDALQGSAAAQDEGAAPPAQAPPAPKGDPFAPDHVLKLAEVLAASEFVRPRVDVPAPFNALTPEQYRDIQFRPEKSVWNGQDLDFDVTLLPLGWIYDIPVEVSVVEDGRSIRLKADSDQFSLGPLTDKAPTDAPFAYSGFSLTTALNRADVQEEFLSFRGASYFRALGRNGRFGLSARGLAINTARPVGEEFPIFRAFWIERPDERATEVIVHGLLDSVSATGAFKFRVAAGAVTEIDVSCTIFARKSLQHVGIAPLTSMFLHGPSDHRRNGDVRPAVHNSEGLAVMNGRGERIWRPLANPRTLQASAFVDKDPKGFGLCQRSRSISHYEDLDLRFDRRPTAWVEPLGNWGDGYVELIEIPAEEAIHDNVVAYWKPANTIEPGKPARYSYRISWGDDVPMPWAPSRAVKTLSGNSRKPDTTEFVVDFTGLALDDLRELPVADLSASSGTISNLSVQRNPEIKGVRIRFELGTAGTDTVELRLALRLQGRLISESWLYRWTRA